MSSWNRSSSQCHSSARNSRQRFRVLHAEQIVDIPVPQINEDIVALPPPQINEVIAKVKFNLFLMTQITRSSWRRFSPRAATQFMR